MIIIYYKNKETGKIVGAQLPRPVDMTMDALAPLIAQHNAIDKYATVAAAVEVADDSLEAYLFNGMIERRKYDKEAVQDVIDAIRTALDFAQSLED